MVKAGVSIVSVAAVTVILFLGGCRLFLGAGGSDEVTRVQSPDGRFEAVLIETNGGATTSFGYKVYIERAGSSRESTFVAHLYGAARSLHAYGANLRWDDVETLNIEYMEAEWAEPVNLNPRIDGRTLTVKLVEGIVDNSAPPGGMQYNLLSN